MDRVDEGSIYHGSVYDASHVYPTLYLTSDVSITGGTGTQSNPYTLSTN